MGDVFFTTAAKVSVLLIFIGIGYLLRRTRKLPENTGKVLSLLTTLIFSPAYTIKNLSASLTVGKRCVRIKIGQHICILSRQCRTIRKDIHGRVVISQSNESHW